MTEDPWQPGPSRPRLADATVDVWLVALDAAGDDAPLSEDERERAARFLRAEDGARWASARGVLRELLAAYTDADPRALRFAEGPHGKPRLAEPASRAGKPALAGDDAPSRALRFNVSHSGDTALVALARGREVGVDVELPRRAVDHVAVARRALPAADADEIAATADPAARERAFLRAWTRWEAVLKCRGTGIGAVHETAAEPQPWVAQLPIAPPAAAAVAVEGGPCAVRTFRWPAAAA